MKDSIINSVWPTTRFRAEWETQDAVLITWPHENSDWQQTLAESERNYVEIATAILARQALIILVHDSEQRTHVESLLTNAVRKALFITVDSNDTWVRDYGPLSVEMEGEASLIDFRFNAWGGKYESQKDDTVSANLCNKGLFKNMHSSELVLEGGAIETNGQGAMLATRSSVISESRNSGLNAQQIEALLSEQLGLSHFHWIECNGLTGDDTDGHIDTLARFTDPETIVYATVERTHPDFGVMQNLGEQLASLRQPNGEAYRLVGLPPPPRRKSVIDDRLLAATYVNFLILNDAVLLPVYNDTNDKLAAEILQQVTSRQVIPIECNTLLEQNGSLHCATMQLAQGTINFEGTDQ
ncbi:peptidylarginine deiminase-like protein [Solemya velum gill symbiont]|uniref:Peptidylarginine deiminase-like protein n=1 Tax=Solemya velum gill symbiont TaxID=2340 RepID=A0A0B0HBF1_SOVGS|nr:agmatine deiminase family protein [Solemya velum gill symbiont]KHF25987.1 peptidylarginine deiminase-like protein [Solemya velum gill symbiont]